MTTPPGQYGGPYAPPPPYGPPPTYQPPPSGPVPYGPAPYGPPGFGGPPQKRRALPWVIVGSAVVLAGLGVLLVVLLTGGDGPTATASAASSSAQESSSQESSSSPPATDTSPGGMAELPDGASTPPPEPQGGPNGPEEPRFAGSDQVALDFMNALLAGDHAAAYRVTCETYQVIAQAQATVTGLPPEDVLAQAFYDTALGGRHFTGGTLDSVGYYPGVQSDRALFTVQVDDGTDAGLYVEIGADLLVCGFG